MKYLALVLAGFVLGVAALWFAYTMPALDAADARVEQAQADLSEAQTEQPLTPDTHCQSVAVGIEDVYFGFRDYLLKQKASAEADGKHAGFAVWETRGNRVVSVQEFPVDRVVPPRPDLYQAMVERCHNEPDRFEIPDGS